MAMAMAGHEVLAACVDMTTLKSACFSFEPNMARRARTASSSSMNVACVLCHWVAPGGGLTRL
eukprot:4225479-Prymnesium_polylepis.1